MNIPIRRTIVPPPPVPDWSPHDKVAAHFNAQNRIDGIVQSMDDAVSFVHLARLGIVFLGGM